MEKTVEVGSIIYVVSKQNKVIPYQVVGETTTKTLNGIELSITIKGSDDSELVIKESDNSKIEYYTSLSDARKTFIERATNAIDKLLSNAEEIAVKTFSPNASDVNTIIGNKQVATSTIKNEKILTKDF